MIVDSECCSAHGDAIVSRSENGKKFEILNPDRKKIQVCRVDGCLLVGAGKKCDYIFVVHGGRAMFVELKGVDMVRALNQIMESAESLRVEKWLGAKVSYIVSAPNPKANSTYLSEIRKLSARFKAVGLDLPVRKNRVITVEA